MKKNTYSKTQLANQITLKFQNPKQKHNRNTKQTSTIITFKQTHKIKTQSPRTKKQASKQKTIIKQKQKQHVNITKLSSNSQQPKINNQGQNKHNQYFKQKLPKSKKHQKYVSKIYYRHLYTITCQSTTIYTYIIIYTTQEKQNSKQQKQNSNLTNKQKKQSWVKSKC